MNELHLFMADIKALTQELGWKHIHLLMTFLVTGLIFLMPLPHVDRDHEITEITFSVTAIGYCVVQWFILSQPTSRSLTVIDLVTFVFIVITVAALRWRIQRKSKLAKVAANAAPRKAAS